MKKRPVLYAFLVALAFFAWVHATPTFGDPDAYYHLEMAKLTAASGPVREFPWLPLTTLADHFADHQFLYHVLLVPFLNIFGDFAGLKIATVLFAALAIAAFTFLLKEYEVRHPFWWTLPLLLAPGFVFRILLTKTSALSLAALFLFLILLRRGNRLAIFFLSFAFVWLYGGWPILIIVALLDALSSALAANGAKTDGRRFLTHFKNVVVVVLGLGAGIVFNPFFPDNLFFYWEQIVQVVVVGHSAAVQVGNEWYPAEMGPLIVENILLFLPLVGLLGLFTFIVLRREAPRVEMSTPRRRAVAFAIALALVFGLMTLRQARHKEYFLPLALFAGALFGELLAEMTDLHAALADLAGRCGRWFRPACVAAALVVLVLAGRAAWISHQLYVDRPVWTRFADAGVWMRAHVPAGETVFHSAWDDFPYLMYRDPDHRYVAGLDPRFFYRNDPEKYWLWLDISEGRRRAGLSELLKNNFNAHYVFLRMDHEDLRPLLKKDPSFERIYADREAEVWRIKE